MSAFEVILASFGDSLANSSSFDLDRNKENHRISVLKLPIEL
jgi:hypothetical protein